MAANHALSNALALECINILLGIAYMFWYRNKFNGDTIINHKVGLSFIFQIVG
jgi:hypothetical protein